MKKQENASGTMRPVGINAMGEMSNVPMSVSIKTKGLSERKYAQKMKKLNVSRAAIYAMDSVRKGVTNVANAVYQIRTNGMDIETVVNSALEGRPHAKDNVWMGSIYAELTVAGICFLLTISNHDSKLL